MVAVLFEAKLKCSFLENIYINIYTRKWSNLVEYIHMWRMLFFGAKLNANTVFSQLILSRAGHAPQNVGKSCWPSRNIIAPRSCKNMAVLHLLL